MSIENAILVELRKELKLKDRILSYILKKYTFKVYKIGFDTGFNKYMMRGCNKAVINKSANSKIACITGFHNIQKEKE